MRLLSIAAVLALAVPALRAQQPVATLPLDYPAPPLVVDGVEVLKVQGQVYMLVGAGGNVTMQVGDEGILLVDAGGPGQAKNLLNAVKRVAPTKPLRFLINTNADADHIGGNGELVTAYQGTRGPRPAGAGGANPLGQNVGVMTVAYEGTYNRMIKGSRDLPALTGDALPISTFFTPRKEFFSNGEGIQVYSQPNAHSDGDALVFFRESDVISAGDVFNTTSYPVINLQQGGSITGVIEALNTLIDLAIPERNQMGGTRVIPGHGRISNEADLIEYRDMVTIVRDRVQEMVKKGMTLAQIKAARPSLEYDGLYGSGSGAGSTDAFLEAVYRGVGGR